MLRNANFAKIVQGVNKAKTYFQNCLLAGVSGEELEDPELEEAATKIQATYRGYATRKQITAMANPAEEVIDIDLNDPGEQTKPLNKCNG